MTERTSDAIFNFAYTMAMRDATMRTAFMGASIYTLLGRTDPNVKDKTHPTNDERQRADEAKDAVKAYMNKLFDGCFTLLDRCFTDEEKQVEHDKFFYDQIDKIIKAFEPYGPESNGIGDRESLEKTFTFGNAQKLLNMTVKYLFISTYLNEDTRKKFQYCHCPMDSIIVDIVIKEAKKEKLGFEKGWVGELREPWSKVTKQNRKQYDRFQELVRKLCKSKNPELSPIAFDYEYWNRNEQEEKIQ